MAGVFYGVGVGPGDPGLLTLQAVEIIKEADVIIAPRTQKKAVSTALAIARSFISPQARIEKLIFPMVYHHETLSTAWEGNKTIILEYLQKGNKVVFLTLGDPMLYSTFIYVYRLLKDCGYPIITVPGIPSFCAIASRLGLPLAEGNEKLCIVPATNEEQELDEALQIAGNLVLMKVYKNYHQVVEKLKNQDYLENSVMVSKCGLEDEEITYNLAEVTEDKKINYLSTVIAKRKNF
ncbi:MAG: precorrin-2 C(20)-methyltransferase [Peptococcaceae bacterium]